MKIAVALSGLLLLGAVYPVTPHFGGPPPPRFRGNVTGEITFTDRAGIDRECKIAPEGMERQGCKRGNRIIVSNPCRLENPTRLEATICHELGHLNGWPRTHGE